MAGYEPSWDTMAAAPPNPSTDPENPTPRWDIDPENPTPQRDIDPENPTPRRATCFRRRCFETCICIALLIAVITGLVLFVIDATAYTVPSVAIDSVSGIAPTNLTLEHVEFNLTLRIDSPDSLWSWKCMDAGVYVEVSYRSVPLAATAATPDKLCVGPRKSRDEHIVARGVDVHLPGYMMDSLMTDIRSGVMVFGITLEQQSV